MGSAAAAQQSEPRVPPDYYVWAFPGSPIRIHLRLETVARLRQCLTAAISAGVEPGGLLFGKVEARCVEITDFVQFEPDGISPGFALKGTERERLKETIQQSNAGRQPSVVGYFRGARNGGIRLSEDDLSLIQECLRNPSNVFLVTTQDEGGAATAGFFFWDSGTIFAEASFMQFPLDERLLAAPKAPVRPPDQLMVPGKTGVSETVAPARSSRRNSVPRLAWVLGLLVIACALAAYVSFRPRAPQDTVARLGASSPMSLSASRTDKDVAITWDSKLPLVSDARIGVLTIKDGDSQTELPLTRTQLQISKLIYAPRTDRLEVTLEVFSPAGKSTTESIMLALAEWSAPSKSGPASVGEQGRKEYPKALVNPPARQTDTSENEVIPASSAKEVRRFAALPPAPRKDPLEGGGIVNVPPPAQVGASDPAGVLAGVKAPDFVAPSPVQPVVKKEPVPAPPLVDPVRRETGLSPPPIQPPKPIRQIRPVVPPNVAAMLKSRVDVQVRVSIDENGKVISSEPVVSPGALNQYLGSTAASAARLWTFEPARRGDKAVISEMLLQFSFAP